MEKEFCFKAFVYNSHIQAILVAIFFFCVIILLPFAMIFGYLFPEWNSSNNALANNLLKFGLVGLPLVYLYVRCLIYFFKKQIIVQINDFRLIMHNSKNKKEYINIQFDNNFNIRIVDRIVNELNRTFHIVLKREKKSKLIFWSAKKIKETNQEFIDFEEFKIHLESILDKLNIKKDIDKTYQGQIIVKIYKN